MLLIESALFLLAVILRDEFGRWKNLKLPATSIKKKWVVDKYLASYVTHIFKFD